MRPHPLSPRSAVLLTLRHLAGWSSFDLVRVSQLAASTLSRYENGHLELEEERLLWLTGLMGYCEEEVRLALAVAERRKPEALEPAHPLELDAEEQRKLTADTIRFVLGMEPRVRDALFVARRRQKVDDGREHAEALVRELEPAEPEERTRRVETEPGFQLWALAPALGERSVRSLGHSVEEAAEWAGLAALAAERAAVPESWRPRLRAAALFFSANVERVANCLEASEEAYAQAWALWKENPAEGLPLGEWRYVDLESSLRCDQRRWDEAIPSLHKALELAPAEAVPRLRLQLGRALNDMGEPGQALEVLELARPDVEEGGDLRLLCTLSSHLALSLLGLGRASEAEPHAANAQRLARDGMARLDILRNDWVAAEVSAALGHLASARLTFAEVRKGFKDLHLAFDAARAGLDEALVLLRSGAHEEVKELAGELIWIFRSGQLKGDALAALRFFCEAAHQEEATADLVRLTASAFEATVSGSGGTPPKTRA